MKTIFTLLTLIFCAVYAHATTITVAATGTSFSPANLTVHTGDIVHWVFDGTHDVTSGSACKGDGKFSSGTKNSGDTYDFTFTATGTFPYYCSFHCSLGMTGVITVTAPSGIDPESLSASMFNCYPNPFTKNMSLDFEITKSAKVNIDILSISGQKVMTLEMNAAAGSHHEILDMGKYSNGIYFLRINIDGVPAKEAILVKN
jgi:plastocyanin